MAEQRRGQGIGRMQGRAVDAVAPPAVDVSVGVSRHLLAAGSAQLVFEGLLIDDDVHQRLRRPHVGNCGSGPAEDLEQRVRPALLRRPGQVLDPGVGPVLLPGVGPVGGELGVLEAVRIAAPWKAPKAPQM